MNAPSSNTGKLEWVQIITSHISEYVRAWIDSIELAGAIMENGVGEVIEKKSIKIGVIIWPASLSERQRVIDICEQQLADDGTLSVRYFILADQSDAEIPEHHRARLVLFKNMSPNDFVDRLNRSLYKARLPVFLRKGFNAEICEELLEIDDIKYRKIILRSYKMAPKNAEIEYESLYLYIHNKELYEIRDGEVTKISEDWFVMVRHGNQIVTQNNRFDAQMPLGSLRNNDSDE